MASSAPAASPTTAHLHRRYFHHQRTCHQLRRKTLLAIFPRHLHRKRHQPRHHQNHQHHRHLHRQLHRQRLHLRPRHQHLPAKRHHPPRRPHDRLHWRPIHLQHLHQPGTLHQRRHSSLRPTSTITNSAAFSQSGPQSWSPGATFTNTAGLATFNSNAKLYGLTITAGTIDIINSKFVIEATTNKSITLATLQQNITTHALTSSTLPTNYALALIDNSALVIPFKNFGGQPVDATSILLSPELLGDANADGQYRPLRPLSTILNHFGATTPNWTDGNFDHASTIDLTDLSAVLNHFGQSNPNASATVAMPSSAPEPAPFSAPRYAGAALLLSKRGSAVQFPSPAPHPWPLITSSTPTPSSPPPVDSQPPACARSAPDVSAPFK